jgi:hypothetical protein
VSTLVLAHLTGYYAGRPTEKLGDLIKVALTISGGIGAAVALVVAYRRQRVTEAAHDLARSVAMATEHDAAERRITDLYLKAVEQLGSDKAPVRLGGLYGLERLAQDNPAHRQTVVNVVCAYLRMPYAPPQSSGAELSGTAVQDSETTTQSGRRSRVVVPDPREEREVRATAQRLLQDHLTLLDLAKTPDEVAARPPSPGHAFWPEMRLNLDGAYLEDFVLPYGMIKSSTFIGTNFAGRNTIFTAARILWGAEFNEAVFKSSSLFFQTKFGLPVSFSGARFASEVEFRGSEFGSVDFTKAIFAGRTVFDEATFSVPGAAFGFRDAVFSAGVTGLMENPAFAGWAFQPLPEQPHLMHVVPVEDSGHDSGETPG